ncbi:ATP-dependent DNA helicase DinG [Vibrio salinus]|uniref:ATP-dependent DNA helicase DinG n=1 Tax=Vibrio salinus TaxID=2899784 RepID=UPI001E5DBD65|nr:ATP-dependent DNA helicase DinG [Vibrio salinus]MCE0492832.1 ATP-dependent DNA helicase DinG [Vibrio salinus]
MLSPNIQNSIQQSYKNLQHHLEKFVPRRAQNYLTSEIAKTLCGSYHSSNRILVAEAGTGIGKSLSYLMAAIPVAILNNRKLIISTATVALQEQLITKDLPLLLRVSPLEFQFRIAKGRQRYCCKQRLATLATDQPDQQLGLLDSPPDETIQPLIQELYAAICKNKWDGDRDNWSSTIPDELWSLIVSDKHSCHHGFHQHHQCPYQKARQELDVADIIVANHHLVLADAELGGGVVLPDPENCIYIFDEAHHIASISRDSSAAAASIKGASNWLETLNKNSAKYLKNLDESRAYRFRNELTDAIQQIIPLLKDVKQNITQSYFHENIWRFEHGELPEWLESIARDLKTLTKKANQNLGKITDLIAERVKEGNLSTKVADPLLNELSFYLLRMDNLTRVWSMMATPAKEYGAPLARWIEYKQDNQDDFIVNASPLEVGWKLDQQLWSRCVGAVFVSATLRALNSFDHFCFQTGISNKEQDGVKFLALASPFDYQNHAELLIPAMESEPSSDKFTDELAEKIPFYIEEKKANLVLFSSYWQMEAVTKKISKKLKRKKWQLLVQGKSSRQSLLNSHSFTIKMGGTSILFGTGSFSEGLDLPGNLLENVIITKIPFSVPTSPIEQAHAEYIESKGGNAFLQIAVPDASKKLVQSVGRLIRKESDSGRVVILDRRIVSKRYGRSLLDSLPPLKRTIEYIS